MSRAATLLAIIAAVLGSGCGPSSPAEQERLGKRLAIEKCWENQAQKSLTPAEARFIAGACESMERKYLEQYGSKP